MQTDTVIFRTFIALASDDEWDPTMYSKNCFFPRYFSSLVRVERQAEARFIF